MRLEVPWLVGLLVMAGCSSDTAEVSGPPGATGDSTRTSLGTGSVSVLPCSEMIFTGEDLPEDYEVLLDVIALPTAKTAPQALQVGHHQGKSPNYFAKTGLLVRSGAVFDLEVEHPPEVAVIGWGSSMDSASQISSQGCEGDDWIAFAGGFTVREPMCMRLTLTAESQEKSFDVGAGAACEGQQPPFDPLSG